MRALELAIILTAYDRATRVVNNSINQMETRMRGFQQNMQRGFVAFGAGTMGASMLKGPINAMESFETAAASLRSSMMLPGGILDTKQWEKVEKLAMKLGGDLPGTNEDMIKMMDVMKRNGVAMNDILDGTAEAAAKLGFVNAESYEQTAKVFSHIHNAVGIAGKDMPKFADLLNRAIRTGASMTDLEYAFGRSGNQLRYLGLTGVEANKSMMALYATFIRGGATGQTVGTNFARIMSEILNPKHYSEMQLAAQKYLGTTIDLLDKQGNFRGVENMIAQFDKMKGLSHAKIADILNPLTGGQGLDDTILKILSKGGKAEYNKTVTDMFAKTATLNRMASEQLNTPGAKWEQAMGEFHNMLIEIGKTLKPILMPTYDMLRKIFSTLQSFVQNHPILTRTIGIFIALSSGALMFMGALRMVRAVMLLLQITGSGGLLSGISMAFFRLRYFAVFNLIPALQAVGTAAWATITTRFLPAMAMAAASVRSLYLSILYRLGAAFTAVSAWTTGILVPAIASVGRALFALATNPVVLIVAALVGATILIIRNWSKIKDFFGGLLTYLGSIVSKFYQAGVNIIMSVFRGMKSAFSMPIDLMKNMVKAIRDFLPFSPAKTGPLKDIHKIRLVETIAQGIKAGPAIGAMRSVAGSIANYGPGRSSGGGGGLVVNYSPVIHLGGGTTKDGLLEVLNQHKREVVDLIEDTIRRKERVAY